MHGEQRAKIGMRPLTDERPLPSVLRFVRCLWEMQRGIPVMAQRLPRLVQQVEVSTQPGMLLPCRLASSSVPSSVPPTPLSVAHPPPWGPAAEHWPLVLQHTRFDGSVLTGLFYLPLWTFSANYSRSPFVELWLGHFLLLYLVWNFAMLPVRPFHYC